jgi:hypothetical protein
MAMGPLSGANCLLGAALTIMNCCLDPCFILLLRLIQPIDVKPVEEKGEQKRKEEGVRENRRVGEGVTENR